MKIKKVAILVLPSLLLLFLMYLSNLSGEDEKQFVPTDKPVMIIVTNDTCEDCEKQKEVWAKFKSENPNTLLSYDQLTINNAAYSDTANFLSIQGFPTIVGLSPTGEVLYSNSAYHNQEDLEKATALILDNENELQSQKNQSSEEDAK